MKWNEFVGPFFPCSYHIDQKLHLNHLYDQSLYEHMSLYEIYINQSLYEQFCNISSA